MCLGNPILSLHASGRTFSLNLFKCIYSDYTVSKQTREHLEKLVGSSGSLGLCCFHSSENTGEISALLVPGLAQTQKVCSGNSSVQPERWRRLEMSQWENVGRGRKLKKTKCILVSGRQKENFQRINRRKRHRASLLAYRTKMICRWLAEGVT